MVRRKTNEEFTKRAYDLVGDEYKFLEEYKGSKTKIKVKHTDCGEKYYVSPNSFLTGTRCRKCRYEQATKNNTKTNESFIKDVFKLVGNEYTFLENYINNHTKIQCKHETCAYEWGVIPNNFIRGDRCPKCAGFYKSNEEFLKEVYDLTKSEYTFLEDYHLAKNKICVIHNKCGHKYKVEPQKFLSGRRCPKCFGNALKTDVEFREELKSLKDDYENIENYVNSKEKIKFKHLACGHIWTAMPYSVLQGKGCPKCSSSKGERIIYDYLKSLNIEFNTQYKTPDCKHKLPLPFDFEIVSSIDTVKLLIEFDGEQHYQPVNFGGKTSEEAQSIFNHQQRKDQIKNNYCLNNNIPLLRIPYWESENIEHILFNFLVEHGVLEEIKELENICSTNI